MPNPIAEQNAKREREEKSDKPSPSRPAQFFRAPLGLKILMRIGNLSKYVENHHITNEQLHDWYRRKPFILEIIGSHHMHREIRHNGFNVYQLERLAETQLHLLHDAASQGGALFTEIMERLFNHTSLQNKPHFNLF
jgi:hypothetical protein